MTVSISSGHSADYLTGAVASGRESYYLDATTDGEPPGRWWGKGAEAFGLTGEVDPGVMEALYGDLRDPRDERFADPETRDECPRLGRAPQRARDTEAVIAERLKACPGTPLPEDKHRIRQEVEREASKAVLFHDLTYSPQKSVTVLHTAFRRAELDAQRAGNTEEAALWASRRHAVEAAVWAGNEAMLTYASTRAGYDRQGSAATGLRFVKNDNWTVASFFQHTSRDLDPQLHIHNAALNRVVGEDGKVRTLDSRGLHRVKQAAGTIADRTTEEALTRSLGVQWRLRPDGKAREIVGVDQEAMDLFSKRSRTLSAKARELVAKAEARYGRTLTSYERERVRRQASMATRRAKSHDGETTEQQLDRWDAEARGEVAGGLHRIADRFRETRPAEAAGTFSPEDVMSRAVAACQEGQSTWGRSELIRQTLLALPDNLGGLTGEEITALAEGLADRALASDDVVQVAGGDLDVDVPESLRRPDGPSVYETPNAQRYASRSHVRAEEAIRQAAIVRGRVAASGKAVDAWLSEHGEDLGPDQAAAVRGIATSDAALTVLVGPAGTGKSYTAGAFTAAWEATTGGRVVGLAVSQVATEVLRDDGVPLSLNTSQWLDAQDRLSDGRGSHADATWRLRATDVVLVDEASMISTAQLDAIRERVDAAGARMILTGDPQQLGAVDAGGMMARLSDREAETYSLSDVRRFSAGWEREASLRLRAGDLDAAHEYARRGRVVDAGTREEAGEAAGRAYVADRLQGRTAVVVVPTNEEAAAVSAQIRDRFVALGMVEADGVVLGRDGCTAGVGDTVACRRNDYAIGVTNRRQYTVEAVGEDGSLTVRPVGGGAPRTLPADYVGADVALGYAGTIHAAQGITVDRAHLVAADGMPPEGVYVGLTRGRDGNTAYVATVPVDGDGREGDRRDAEAVLAAAMDQDRDEARSAVAEAEADAEALASEATIHGRIEDAVRVATRARTDDTLDRLVEDGTLSAEDRARLGAEQGTEYLSRVLRRVEQAGGDPEEALRSALADPRGLDSAAAASQVLSARITSSVDLTPAAEADAVPAGLPDDVTRYLGQLHELADERRRELGSQVAEEAPRWAVDSLGPVPDGVVERAEWEHRAGVVAAHREASGWTDKAVPLGQAPALSSTEARASFHSAWEALGCPEANAGEAELSAGALRARVAAWEREQAAAPEYVDEGLAQASRAAARGEQDATLAAAEGDEEEAAQAAEDAARGALVAEALTEGAEGRDAWLVNTAATRAAAERAEAEMARRGLPASGEEPDRVTPAEWLAAEAQARVEDDAHRRITETDLADEETDEADDAEQLDERDAAAVEAVEEADTVEEATDSAGDTADDDDSAEKVQEAPEERRAPVSVEEAEAVAARARVAAATVADRDSEEAARRDSEASADVASEDDAESAWRDEERRRQLAQEAERYDVAEAEA